MGELILRADEVDGGAVNPSKRCMQSEGLI